MMLILGGTTEARLVLERLVEEREPIIISTAYQFAGDFIKKDPLIEHITGKLDEEELLTLVVNRNIDVIVDTTHPYALEISRNARRVCERAAIKYIRLERDLADVKRIEWAHYVDSFEEAAALACTLGEKLFLATGSNSAGIFRQEAESKACKAYVRILPDVTSLNRCIDAGFSTDEMITGVGPFTYEENYNLWRALDIDVVVTKESGIAGGFNEKVDAARELGLEVVVVRRPPQDVEVASSIDEVLDALRETLRPNIGITTRA